MSGRCCGEREYRRTSEALGDSAEGEIVGSEVVAPLTDAVRLIDYEQANRPGEKVLEECTVLEPLRREVEDLPFTFGDLPVRLAALGCGEVRVHRD